MGIGPRIDYELWLVNDHLVDPLDQGRALATTIDNGSVVCPFIAMHCKQSGEQLSDKDLAAW